MKLTSFIGKGGVGKSTLAVLLSLFYSDKTKTICIGLDQQHNHRDIIQQNAYKVEYIAITNKISDMIEEAIENSFAKGYREYGELIMPSFTSIVELAELLSQVGDKYDHLVIDMPPNTQGLLMLDMPPLLSNMAFKSMTIKNRINKMLKGKDVLLDNVDYINDISIKLKKAMKESDFFVVGITTELGFLECQRAITKLKEMEYNIKAVIVNMVEPLPNADCDLCFSRYMFANKYLEKYNAYFGKMKIPVIQIRFTYDNDEIYDDLITGCFDIDLFDD